MESRGIFFLAHMTTSRNLYTIIPWMFCFCDIPFTFNDPDEITRRTNHNPRCNYIPWNYAPENKPSQKETIVFQPLILIPMFREGSFAGSKFIKTYPWCFSKKSMTAARMIQMGKNDGTFTGVFLRKRLVHFYVCCRVCRLKSHSKRPLNTP